MTTIQLKIKSLAKGTNSLLLLAAFCVALLLVRAKVAHSLFFFFLVWNLFLAWLPLGISTILKRKQQWQDNRWYLGLLLLSWVALLPNAPYIITDFIHLKRELAVAVWFDVLLLISFSITGILFGLASMNDILVILKKKYNSRIAWLSMATTCLLSGFGIYIGSYLRYNSWDLLQRPLEITTDIIATLSNPLELKAATGITLGFGVLLFLLFHLYHNPEKNL